MSIIKNKPQSDISKMFAANLGDILKLKVVRDITVIDVSTSTSLKAFCATCTHQQLVAGKRMDH